MAVAPGDYVINDDADGRPGTVTSPDGTFKEYVASVPAGEMGAILPNGISIWHDRYNELDATHQIALLDADLNHITSVSCGSVTTTFFPKFATDATKFYVLD